VNARGVLKSENGVVKKYIAKITASPLTATVSGEAMRLTLGLSEIAGDIVLAAPAERVEDAPMLGLAVRSDVQGMISAHRVLLLVQGTTPSKLDAIGGADQSLTAQSYRVASKNVRCLLSDKETYIDLHGYCDFNNMLTYRLDKDVALVLVSAISEGPVATIEHMQKVGDAEKASLLNSLAVEWKTALTDGPFRVAGSSCESPQKSEYWERPTKKLKRLESEATAETTGH
jgi:hypothetical protein